MLVPFTHGSGGLSRPCSRFLGAGPLSGDSEEARLALVVDPHRRSMLANLPQQLTALRAAAERLIR
jgi:hypothetical protein